MALEGSDKDQLAVIGVDVDSDKLTCLLEKKKKLDDEKPESLNCTITPSYPPFPRFCEVVVYDPSPSSYSIM